MSPLNLLRHIVACIHGAYKYFSQIPSFVDLDLRTCQKPFSPFGYFPPVEGSFLRRFLP